MWVPPPRRLAWVLRGGGRSGSGVWGDAITEDVEVAESEEGGSHTLLLLEAGGPSLFMTGVGWGRGWDGVRVGLHPCLPGMQPVLAASSDGSSDQSPQTEIKRHWWAWRSCTSTAAVSTLKG